MNVKLFPTVSQKKAVEFHVITASRGSILPLSSHASQKGGVDSFVLRTAKNSGCVVGVVYMYVTAFRVRLLKNRVDEKRSSPQVM